MPIQYQLVTVRDELGAIIAFEIRNSVGQQQGIDSWRAQAIAEAIAEILASGQPKRSLAKDAPIVLDEHLGAHIALVIKAVEPLKRYERTHQVAQGIARMSREEAMYWYAHSMDKGGLPALRTLLAP